MDILDGNRLSDDILRDLASDIADSGIRPSLAVIMVGNDQASETYVGRKRVAAERIGMGFFRADLPDTATVDEVIDLVRRFDTDDSVHGIIVQLPLPKELRGATDRIIAAIDPRKDADGFHPENVSRFLSGDDGSVFPIFPRAIMDIMRSSGRPLSGLRAVIVCNSDGFGDVMKEAFRREGMSTETVVRERVQDTLPDETITRIRQADVVVTACGVSGLIRSDMVRDGAIVVDGAFVRTPDGRVVGDVDAVGFRSKRGWISPVPGGVGPVTVARLLDNVFRAARANRS